MIKPLYNNQIRASEIRLVAEDGQQMGVFTLSQALETAKEKGVDLILVTDKTTPPICKLGDYGKYLYSLQKKEKKNIAGSHHSETKNLQLSFNISDNDIGTRVNAAEKFLNKGDKISVELRLRGRENQLSEIGYQKMNKFIEMLKSRVEIKMDQEIKKEVKKLTMIISKK
ncbi:MAG: translation initiation factor IF-3 [Candidatus Paceibacterota bacterium]|jgi:translation initiation factor IF-3